MFRSILGGTAAVRSVPDDGFPDYFHDLRLDTVLAPILRDDPSDTLRSIYLSPPGDISVIRARQDVFRDLADRSLSDFLEDFSGRFSVLSGSLLEMRTASGGRTDPGRRRTEAVFFSLAEEYASGVTELAEAVGSPSVSSSSLRNFSSYLSSYIASDGFRELSSDILSLRKRFSSLKYTVEMRKGTFRVFPYGGEEDLLSETRLLFGDLADEAGGSRMRELRETPYSEDVEEAVMGLLSGIFPDEFRALGAFCTRHRDFADPVVMDFSREIRFYTSWISVAGRLADSGLSFCIPVFSSSSMSAVDFFDMALACEKGRDTVPSSFFLGKGERIIVVTGPNQGGKTTFARAFGALHFLASLGLPVPGRSAELMLTDAVYTHFGRKEDIRGGEGRLEDDVVRLRSILGRCTERSVLVINEIFSSTTADDAVELGDRMLDMIGEKGAVAVVVTFLDELAHHGPETVSMVSRISETEPEARTYRLERGEPDGRALAMGLARRYGLDPDTLARRLEA